MRTALALMLGTALVSSSAFAAWDDCGCSCPSYSPSYTPAMPNQQNMQPNMKRTDAGGYFLKNGKVMVFRNGNITEVNQEITLDNGSRLMADGTIIFADGRREMLRDNQWLTSDGFVSDGAQAVNRFDGNTTVVNQDGYFLQNGRVMVFRNGSSTQLNNEAFLTDGSRIMADGTIIMRDGTRSTLREGQRLDFQGRTSVNASHQQTQPSNTSTDRFNQNTNTQNRDNNSQFNSTTRSNTSGQVNDNHLNTNTNANTNSSINSTTTKTDSTIKSTDSTIKSDANINQGNHQPTNSARPNDRSTTSSADVKTESRPNDRSVPSTTKDSKTLDSTSPSTPSNTQSSSKDSSRPNDRSTPSDSKSVDSNPK